jgi:uncharacterized repeat protein (TIGR01451 family)
MLSIDKSGNFTDKNNYIHYTINFQNTGNALARDIIVTDVLDSKLDLNTLQINQVSHKMETTIDDNRMVKFDFKNIMLVDSNSNEPESHGYIQYMIKPMSTLQVNSVISNEANIHFDFNPPILTNKTMNSYILKSSGGSGGNGSKDSTASITSNVLEEITVFPNPVIDYLNIHSTKNLNSFDIRIYDGNGRMVYKSKTKTTMDISRLEKGVYILHFESDNSKKQIKILKE